MQKRPVSSLLPCCPAPAWLHRHQVTRRASILGAPDVPAGAAVVEVVSPDGVDAALDVVAVGVVGGDVEAGGERDEAVVPVHHLQVAEVGGPAEAFPGEVAAAHLRGRVGARRARVHHLAAELHHARVRRQVAEQQRRPVAHQLAGAELQPPVAVVRVLMKAGYFRLI